MPSLSTPFATPSTPSTTATGAIVPFDLPAGTSTLVCVPEGATLRTHSGSLLIQEGPLVCGQVLVGSAAARMLRTGTTWSAADGGGARWLRITALESTKAQLEERAPRPGWGAQVGRWAAAALAQALRRAPAGLAGTAGSAARPS